MIRARATVAAAVLLASLATAQTSSSTFVVPPGYATKPANSLDQQPFGMDQIRYAQFVDKGYLTGLKSGAKVSEIRYRRDEARLDKIYSSYEPMKRGTTVIPSWQISMGDFQGDYTNLNSEYANRGNMISMTVVFAGSLNYTSMTPNLAPPSSSTTAAPFAMKFPFNVQSFQYLGNGLCVDHLVYESRNRTHRYYVDSIYSEKSNGGKVELLSNTSLGCPSGYNRVYGSAPNPGAGSLKLHLFGAPESKPAICYFGYNVTPVNLWFMGMKSCTLYNSLSFPLGTKTDAFGLATIDIPVPLDSSYLGQVVHNQWGVADARVNPAMGFTLSDAVKVTMGNKLGAETVRMSVISGIGNAANSRYGWFQPNRGAVFQLVY